MQGRVSTQSTIYVDPAIYVGTTCPMSFYPAHSIIFVFLNGNEHQPIDILSGWFDCCVRRFAIDILSKVRSHRVSVWSL
jgi:hypothetical protein